MDGVPGEATSMTPAARRGEYVLRTVKERGKIPHPYGISHGRPMFDRLYGRVPTEWP